MNFALIDNQRSEAIPKAKGICPVCNTPVISKCGNLKAHHWAHETKQNCRNDRWETEGEWHRNWKNKFPEIWQEKIIVFNGEKNIADIQNEQGLVVEFQHSHITSEEQKARESCYKNMIWVVDGTRLKYDFSRFQKKIQENKKEFLTIRQNLKVFSIDFYDEVFSKNWIQCSVPVIFDFLGIENEKNANIFQKYLYCLLPVQSVKPNEWSAFLFYMPRKDFVTFIVDNGWQIFYPKLLSGIVEIQKARNLYIEQQELQKVHVFTNRFLNRYRYNKYRRRF